MQNQPDNLFENLLSLGTSRSLVESAGLDDFFVYIQLALRCCLDLLLNAVHGDQSKYAYLSRLTYAMRTTLCLLVLQDFT